MAFIINRNKFCILEREEKMINTKKILLSALVASSLFFIMNGVNAQEITTTTGDSTEQETTAVSQNAVTSIEDVEMFIPDSITLDIKDTDLFSNNDEIWEGILHEKAQEKIDLIFRSNVEFKTETVTSAIPGMVGNTYEQENFFINGVKMYYDIWVDDMNTLTVSVYERKSPDYYFCSSEEECEEEDIEKTLQTRKIVQVKYSNSNQYNTEDESYVKNAIKNVNFGKVSGIWDTDDEAAYESGLQQYQDYIASAINDASLKVYAQYTSGGGDGDYSVLGTSVAIEKNGVIYAVIDGYNAFFNAVTIPNDVVDTDEAYINYALPKLQEIWNQYTITNVIKIEDDVISAASFGLNIVNDGIFYKILLAGDYCYEEEECFARVILKKESVTKIIDHVSVSDEENVTLSGMVLDQEDSTYKEMLEKSISQGYANVFGAYELKLVSGNIQDGLTVTFSLGTENDGRQVLVLHKKNDGNYESFLKTVQNGKIDVDVTELSPFMVVFNGAIDNTVNNVLSNSSLNNAQTSSIDVVLYSILTISSLIGLVYIVIKNRKKAA